MKSKKLLLGSLSAMALVATPIATVVSCGGNNNDGSSDKVATKASITKSKATGFVVSVDGGYFIPAAQAKAGGSLTIMAEERQMKITWDKKLEAGKAVSVKVFENGKQATAEQLKKMKMETITPTKADDKHFVVQSAGESAGRYNTLDEIKHQFGNFVSEYDGKPQNGVKLLFDKTTKAVTKEGIKIFNDLLKVTGLVVKSATVRISPAVAASASSSSGSSTGTKSSKSVSIVWDTSKEDKADVAAVKALLVKNAITPAVATGAVTAITTATPITDLASLNTATPNIVFSGSLPTVPALKGVSIKIKSLSALAATGSVHGNLVIELSKGQATDTITIAVVGKA